MNKKEIQSEALGLIQEELTKYEEGLFQISRNKSMRMRYLWDLIRENYFGVFKKEKDLIGQQKIFYPLTEALVWENVKNIDVDTKDINVKANQPNQIGLTHIIRNLARKWMEDNDFGEQINDDEMIFCLDGHIIKKKVFETDEITLKKSLKTITVDIRNIFRDMGEGSLQEVDFIERSVQNVSYLKQNFEGKYINLDKLKGSDNIPAIHNEQKSESSSSPEVDVYERWGKIKKSWITGKSSDSDIWVNGRIVASGVLSGCGLIHRIELWNKKRPYEEAKFESAPGRWAGRGIGEKSLYLQLYLNTIYNVRRNNNLQMMNQLFQYREGSGITPEKVSRLLSGGAIGVQQVGDIARIDTKNINFNESISEEQNIVQLANRLASSQEASTGEALPASTPATNAIIQSRAVKTSFQLRQERFSLMLSKLFKNQLSPEFYKLYGKSEIIRLMGEEETPKLKRKLTEFYANKIISEGKVLTPEEADAIKETIKKQLEEREDLWLEIEDLKDADKLDYSFYVTDETFDKGTVLQNLQTVLTSYRQFAQDPNAIVILRNILDILGLDSEGIIGNMTQQPTSDLPGSEETPTLASNQEGVMNTDKTLETQDKKVANQINQ